MITKEDLENFGYYDVMYEEEFKESMTPLQRVKEFAQKLGQDGTPALYRSLLHEEFSEWEEEYQHNTKEEQLKELADLVVVAYGYANVKGWDLDEAFNRVMDNNLGRCIWPDGSIKRREDGKILRNPDYPKVNLEDLVQ